MYICFRKDFTWVWFALPVCLLEVVLEQKADAVSAFFAVAQSVEPVAVSPNQPPNLFS